MNAHQYRRQHDRQPGQCTLCAKPVPKGRRHWCGDKCVRRFRLRYDWKFIRQTVIERDKGRCRDCGCQTPQIERLLRRSVAEGFDTVQHLVAFYAILCGFGSCVDARETTGWRGERYTNLHIRRSLCEVDHIKPRIEGGSDSLRNLRTLCIPCHKAHTAALAARRAERRRRTRKAKR